MDGCSQSDESTDKALIFSVGVVVWIRSLFNFDGSSRPEFGEVVPVIVPHISHAIGE